MSNAAQKEVFVPRSNLQRTLKYRSHLKWQYYLMLGLASVLAVGSLAVYSPQETQYLIEGLVISAVLFLQARFMIKPLAFSTVQVFLDKLIIDRMGQRIELKYSDIIEVKFSYIPYLGGWFKLVLPEKSYRFTAVLERSEYILESIVSYNPNVLPVASLEDYRRTSIIVDHTWSHMSDKFKNWKHLCLKYMAAPVVVGAAFGVLRYIKLGSVNLTPPIALACLYVMAQAFVALVGYVIVSVMMMANIRSDLIRNPNFTARNKPYELKIERRSQLIQKVIMGFVCAAVVFKLMFT